MANLTPEQTGAESVRWKLDDLYPGMESTELQNDMEAVTAKAADFNQRYRDRIAALDAAGLYSALQSFEEITETLNRLETYAYLQWTTDTLNSDFGRFLSKIRKFRAGVERQLVFFRLELLAAPEALTAQAETPALKPYRHWLIVMRQSAPFVLTEPEEKLLHEVSLSGAQAWKRYFGEVMSKARYDLDGKPLTQSEVLRALYSPDRDLRHRAAEALTTGLSALTHTTTFIFNTLGQNKATLDDMRGHQSWIESRNIDNQTDDATVEALVTSVTGRYGIVARYYRLIQRLLGYDTLYDYDRYAPVSQTEWHFEWNKAQKLVLDAFEQFTPRMAHIASQFFDNQWIDAALAPNKRGGAYSHRAVASVHPYILLNYVGNAKSVMTLAHELGHGVHQYLARKQGGLQQPTPLTTAEMASTFAEMLTFDALMQQTDDPRRRLSMRLEKIADTFATVFRQIAMNRFEEGMHTRLRAEGELTTDQFSDIWLQTQQDMFGESLVLRDSYRLWWSYVPHFLAVPGYVYAYAFGELLVWSLYARYQSQPEGFAETYLDVLSRGGSVWPHELVARLGVDLQDAGFWNQGLDLVEEMVVEAETEAAALDYEVLS
ncbi:MAG: M3 family oligoendopeptidase [Chloroflexi bacterium]|nr:M3 family oligoendopeptidase [Chloroflexota bacterium]